MVMKMSVLEYLAKVDFAAVQFEQAKREMESAKANFERSKQAYEEVLTQAEGLGLAKAKLKRVAEERVTALLESGLIDFSKDNTGNTKKPTNDSKGEKGLKAKKKGRSMDLDENSLEPSKNKFDGDVDDEESSHDNYEKNESIEVNA